MPINQYGEVEQEQHPDKRVASDAGQSGGSPPPRKSGPSAMLIGGIILLLLCIGGAGIAAFVTLMPLPDEQEGSTPAQESESGSGSKSGNQKGAAAAGNTTIFIAYGTEKREWMEEAARRFQEQNPQITINLEGVGSRETVKRIVDDELQPTAISPASSIQIALLREEWQTLHDSDILGADDPPPLVITPLVLVAWQERGEVLWPEGSSSEAIWQNLHDVMANPQGWAAFGHPDWGFAKFGHTSPESSNSGIQTLVLMTYAYHDKTTGLSNADILDPGFQAWLDEIETAVVEFGDSTGTFMENMVRYGPSKYDTVAVYESLAIEYAQRAEDRWGQPLQVYYPPANIISDHPYAVLQAEWVSAEQRAAAEQFRDFLLSQEMQELALEYGFRPASLDVPVAPAFEQHADYGIRVDIPQVVEVPSGGVLNELLELWRRADYD